MLTDPIADMITRIRNGAQAGHVSVDIPASKMKLAIADILKREGYIKAYKAIDDGKQGIVRVTLKYYESKPAISGIKRISKPGRRVYKGVRDIPRVRNGLGINILSTSKGIMTDHKAREMGLGGEILISVW
ncbi:MAG TPA: 30S ribosomal protein S8 [Deltaproteobacteria bacterium]|nr:30S ribosomal protein S8 [Deltaproteobacteria bacterium]RLB00874.1 MAG: 30S ribosomal protein S8 [Deltaproteobacteria bacterium]HDM32822.1 30S ribosomal protein S8 [Deltaproteobacteria bacterium]